MSLAFQAEKKTVRSFVFQNNALSIQRNRCLDFFIESARKWRKYPRDEDL